MNLHDYDYNLHELCFPVISKILQVGQCNVTTSQHRWKKKVLILIKLIFNIRLA